MHCRFEHKKRGWNARRPPLLLDNLDLDTVLLAEWRDNASGHAFADRAENRGMGHEREGRAFRPMLPTGQSASGPRHSSSPAISTRATSSPTEAKEQENITGRIISTDLHRRLSCQISGGLRMAPAASGFGTPLQALAFGSTTLFGNSEFDVAASQSAPRTTERAMNA
jgi:hypothetical protein